MIREFLGKIFSIRTTRQCNILTLLGEEYVPFKTIEDLSDKNKILLAALEKRIAAMKIMDDRLKKNQILIEKMDKALEAQNRQMHELMDTIYEQRRQLKQLDQIDWRMNKLKLEQKKIKRLANWE